MILWLFFAIILSLELDKVLKMIYIESTFEDGTYINNIEFKESNVFVETSEGEELEFSLNEEIQVRVFDIVEIETVQDFIEAVKDNRVYCNQDLEKESLMQVFQKIILKPLSQKNI